MAGVVNERPALIDTSAALALRNRDDPLHRIACDFFALRSNVRWCVLNSTSHESFTRARYDAGLERGLDVYSFLRAAKAGFQLLDFGVPDEVVAIEFLKKYADQRLSFHDALCAAVMLRVGIGKVFTFDADFWAFGFLVLPGPTRSRKS